MKKSLFLVIGLFFIGFSVQAQRGSDQRMEQQALINGCNDGTDARGKQNFGNAYYSIMNNSSISAEYKDAYREGYVRCLSGGKFSWKKDVLVYTPPKNPKDNTIKPGIYSFKTYLGALKK